MDFITLLDQYVTIQQYTGSPLWYMHVHLSVNTKCLTRFISHTIPAQPLRKILRHKNHFQLQRVVIIFFFFLNVSITLKIEHEMNRLFRCTLILFSTTYFGGISISTRLYQNNKFFVIFSSFLFFIDWPLGVKQRIAGL